MKLADWLYTNSITPEQLRRMLGLKQRSTVYRHLNGDRKPSKPVMDKIKLITDGEVGEADFEDTSPPNCAAVIEDANGNPRLVFPWSRGQQYQEAAYRSSRDPEPGPDRVSNTIMKALNILGGRARLTQRGRFMLDGRPTDARRVVVAANELLEERGKPLLEYPGTTRGLK